MEKIKWEYKVIHLNVEKDRGNSMNFQSPKKASDKTKGVLSEEFLKKEFPKHFESSKSQKNTAAQLNDFFNTVGNEGWELIEKLEISNQLMLIFKRKIEDIYLKN